MTDKDSPTGAAAVYGCLAAVVAVGLFVVWAFTHLGG